MPSEGGGWLVHFDGRGVITDAETLQVGDHDPLAVVERVYGGLIDLGAGDLLARRVMDENTPGQTVEQAAHVRFIIRPGWETSMAVSIGRAVSQAWKSVFRRQDCTAK